MKKQFLAMLLVLILIMKTGCESENNNDEENITKTVISSQNAPAAIGPYSQAILVGNTLYCSGQIAINPSTNEMVQNDIQAEAHQVLKNLGAVLKAADMDYGNVVRATVFLKDMDDYGRVNEVYKEYFNQNPPARAAVQVARLPKDAGVEISLIAVKTK